jgi:hypothetical protein
LIGRRKAFIIRSSLMRAGLASWGVIVKGPLRRAAS